MKWLTPSGDATLLRIKAVPGASKTAWGGLHGDEAIKVRIAAPPVDGAANKALLEFLAHAFSLSKSDVELMKGGASQHKQVRIALPHAQVEDFVRSFLDLPRR